MEKVRLPDNYKELPTEALLDLKDQIETSNDKVKAKISAAKARAVQGVYADPDWFSRINIVRHKLGRFSQKIQTELSKRKRTTVVNNLP